MFRTIINKVWGVIKNPKLQVGANIFFLGFTLAYAYRMHNNDMHEVRNLMLVSALSYIVALGFWVLITKKK